MSINKYLFTAFFAFILFFSAFSFVNAATYYVSPSGNDSNSGTETQPFKTIQKGANSVSPGDTVIVKDGTYTGSGNEVVNIHTSGTPGNEITFKSQNKWGATIDGEDARTNVLYFGSNVDYVRIEDFDLKRSTFSIIMMNQANCNDITIYRNRIHDNANNNYQDQSGHNGIRVKSDARNIVIDSNIIYDIGRNQPGGLDRKHDHGIYTSAPVRIINNLFYDNLSGYDVKINGGSNHVIINNTFADANPDRPGHFVIGPGSAVTNTLIQNNISYNPKTAMVHNYDAGNDLIMKNNVTNSANLVNANPVTASNNITNANILFTDAGNRDYTLQSGSDGIDDGISTLAPSVDHDGNSRPQGSAIDAGAYEYGGTAPSPTYQCSDNTDNDGDGLIDMNDPGCSSTTDNDEFNTTQPQTCTSFTYSDWSPTTCPVDETQTRSITSSSPSGCTGGTPDLLTQSCTYTPPPPGTSFSQYHEAETMNLTSPMTVGNDANASGGQYISPSTGANSTNPQQEATLNITLPSTDIYYIWTKINGPDLSSDAMYVGIDGNWDRIFPSTLNVYEWVKVETVHSSNNYQFNLTQGDHTLHIGHGEINARIDTLFITNDQNEIPTAPPQTPTLQGDLNQDNTVNSLDWSIMNASWGTSNTQADLNNDGVVNTIDFSILNSEWGQNI